MASPHTSQEKGNKASRPWYERSWRCPIEPLPLPNRQSSRWGLFLLGICSWLWCLCAALFCGVGTPIRDTSQWRNTKCAVLVFICPFASWWTRGGRPARNTPSRCRGCFYPRRSLSTSLYTRSPVSTWLLLLLSPLLDAFNSSWKCLSVSLHIYCCLFGVALCTQPRRSLSRACLGFRSLSVRFFGLSFIKTSLNDLKFDLLFISMPFRIYINLKYIKYFLLKNCKWLFTID